MLDYDILGPMAIRTAAVIVVHYVSILLLVRSCRNRADWRRALESWEDANRDWERAKGSLIHATTDVKGAQRRTNGKLENLEVAATEAAEESRERDSNLQGPEQIAKKAEEDPKERVRVARLELDVASKAVQTEAREVLESWLKQFCVAVQGCWVLAPKLAVATWLEFKSIIVRIVKHRWLVGVILAVVGILHEYLYYDRLEFNVLPYHFDSAGESLILVVLVAVAIAFGLLLVFVVFLFVIDLFLIILSLLLILSAWLVAFVLGWASIWALWFYRHSVRFSQLTLLLVGRSTTPAGGCQPLVPANGGMKPGLIKSIKGRNVFFIRSVFILLTILSLVYVLSVEPQYRAHVTCHGHNRVRVVINDPPAAFGEPMIRIGSSRSYLFALPAEGGPRKKLEESRCQYLISGLGQSFSDSLEFLFYLRAPEVTGAVIALPATRVHCLYEEDSDQAEALCAPPVPRSDYEERLLWQQLAAKVRDCEHPIVSAPFLFKPGQWKSPISQPEAWVADLKRQYQLPNRGAVGQTLYVFGLASADGSGDFNKRLARDRAKTVRAIVKRELPGLNIRLRSLGENHLTNTVANSRSARLVSCAEQVETN